MPLPGNNVGFLFQRGVFKRVYTFNNAFIKKMLMPIDILTSSLKNSREILRFLLDNFLKIIEGLAQMPLPGNNLGVWI